MVSYIPRLAFNDDVFKSIRETKDASGLSWARFIEEAAKVYADRIL